MIIMRRNINQPESPQNLNRFIIRRLGGSTVIIRVLHMSIKLEERFKMLNRDVESKWNF